MGEWLMRRGFTIVELLIVIVVIAILAAITIVAYTGIQQRAKQSSLQSQLSSAAKQIEAARYEGASSDQYPASLPSAATATSGTTFSYTKNATSNNYCLSTTDSTSTYRVTSFSSSPVEGDCTISNGLAGWRRMNGNATESVRNVSATVSGATLTTGQNGQSNGAYSLNGSSNYLSMANHASYLPISTISVSVWARPASLGNNAQKLISKSEGSGYAMSLNGSGQDTTCNPHDICFFIHTSSWNTVGYPKSNITTNEWAYIVGTYDGNYMRLYLNGEEVSSNALSGSIASNSGPLCFGSELSSACNNGGVYYNGQLDDTRVYNRALSAEEVQTLYAQGAQ